MVAYDPSLNSAATRSSGPHSDFATGSAGSLSTMFGLPFPATTTFGFDKLTTADAIRKNVASMTIKTSPEVTQQVVQALNAHSGHKWYTTGGYACASSCAKILHQIVQLKGICCDYALVPNAFSTIFMREAMETGRHRYRPRVVQYSSRVPNMSI